MDRLVTDIVVRRTGQVFVIGVLLGLVLLCVGINYVVIGRAAGWVEDTSSWAKAFQFLSLPFRNAFSPLAVVFTAVVPVAFSKVCYQINRSANPILVSDDLNIVGQVAFLVTAIGLAIGAITVIDFTLNEPTVTLLSGPGGRDNVQGLLNSIIGFDGVYFVQLLGLKPK